MWLQDLLERVGQAGLGQDHRRAGGNVFVDHPVRRQVDEAELPQLARGGQAVELGLARVGPEQDPGRPIVGFEEPGERLDLVSRARQGGEVLVARPRRHEHLLQLAIFGDRDRCRPGVDHDAELAGGQISPGRPAVSPDLDGDRLVALGDDLEVVLLVQRDCRCRRARHPPASGRGSRRWSRVSTTLTSRPWSGSGLGSLDLSGRS